MTAPISRQQFDEITLLLNQGADREPLKQRDIAQRVGVSERTVNSVSTGRIGRPPAARERAVRPRMHDDREFKLVNEYTCPGCHNRVTLSPCLICHERAKRERNRKY